MTPDKSYTLLVVDDEVSITRALQRLFRKEGYHILTAQSGDEGLTLLQAESRNVALIISDQRMPGMSGDQFLEKARKIVPDAMRFLLTGYADMEAVIKAVNNGGIHRYLTKPWNDDALLLHVRQCLEHFELLNENRRL
ncbi:MAG: response regulator, partial [Desulfatitalea sp.]|nr:response regulator [Desulfatitalea sp.]